MGIGPEKTSTEEFFTILRIFGVIFLIYSHFGGSSTRLHFRRVAVPATSDPKNKTIETFRKTLAGPVSAFVDSAFNFPFIFVKNMRQSDAFGMLKRQFLSGEITPAAAGRMAYSGFGPFYAGYASSMAVSHFLNHQFTDLYLEKTQQKTLPTWVTYTLPIMASATAGWAIVTPTEFLMFKQQEAASQGRSMPLPLLMQNLWKTQGVSGFFQSAILTTAREGAFGATVFLPLVVQRHLEVYHINKWAAFFASSAIVATISATISNAIDALTTRYRRMPVNTPLGPWIVNEFTQDAKGLMTKGLGTRVAMYFNGAVVLNLVRPLVEGPAASEK